MQDPNQIEMIFSNGVAAFGSHNSEMQRQDYLHKTEEMLIVQNDMMTAPCGVIRVEGHAAE